MPRGRTYTTNQNTTAATEFVVAPLAGITTHAGDSIDLEGSLTMVAGAGTTAIVARIRRGIDATGTLIGSIATVTLAAGNRGVITLNVSDSPPESQNLSYVLTVQQTGGTAAGTVEQANLTGLWGV